MSTMSVIEEIFSLLSQKRECWRPGEDFEGLPDYSDENDATHPFLADLVLRGLKLPPGPQEDRIEFAGVMEKGEVPFLRKMLCYGFMEEETKLQCSVICQGGEELVFTASGNLPGAAVISGGAGTGIETGTGEGGMKVSLSAFSFRSGMSRETFLHPAFFYKGTLAGTRQAFPVELYGLAGTGRLELRGDFEDGGLMGLEDVLAVLGLGEEFHFGEYLPASLDQKLFRNLGLRSISVDMSVSVDTAVSAGISGAGGAAGCMPGDLSGIMPGDLSGIMPGDLSGIMPGDISDIMPGDLSGIMPGDLSGIMPGDLSGIMPGFRVESFRTEVSLKEPWQITEKISLLPLFCVQVVEPYNPEQRFMSFQMQGEWKLGETVYEVYADPALGDYELQIREGESLDFDAIAGLFLDTELPSVRIDTLSMRANFKNGAYSFRLGASDLWHFSLCGRELSVERVSLGVWYSGGAYQVSLFGEFSFAGVDFGLCCGYGAGGNYQISAYAREKPNLGLTDLMSQVPECGIRLPEQMKAFRIENLELACAGGVRSSFGFDCKVALESGDMLLDRAFSARAHILFTGSREEAGGKWNFGFEASAEILLAGSQSISCSYRYEGDRPEGQNLLSLSYKPVSPAEALSFGELLAAMGITGVDGSWAFLGEVGIAKLALSYDFGKKELAGELDLSTGGMLKVKFLLAGGLEYAVTMASTEVISLGDIPVVGGLAEKFSLPAQDFAVSHIVLYANSEAYATQTLPAGLGLEFQALNERRYCQIYEKKPRKLREGAAPGTGETAKTFWLNLEKTMAIFTLHRVGLSLDGGRMGMLFDASLNVAPLTIEAMGMGLYTDLRNPADVSFGLSGLGLSVSRPPVEISGSFMRSRQEGREVYAGSLLIRAAGFSAFALGQYSEGAFMAYACVSTPLGGPPAFRVMGLALGFGYNENLALPDIEAVPAYPLILGAKGEIGQGALPAKLAEYITPLEGQNFLAAGVHFTSFEIADSFALVTVAFGKKLQVGLLGLSDITMPPNCSDTPIAHAQLALRASFTPDEGLFAARAQLTSESYILSKSCRLTGGFAFCLWFGQEHRGDFVITLGGYHPRYKKPAHYPDVPRLGFQWDVIPEKPGRLVLGGEIYFALTPSAIMAGGLLSAVYADGNLRAWFTARADFLICWKPFRYDLEVGISLGASYRLKLGFIKHTFKVELGCSLRIWGPDFTGKARITWFIISFTISFGAGADDKPKAISWGEFSDSFLPQGTGTYAGRSRHADRPGHAGKSGHAGANGLMYGEPGHVDGLLHVDESVQAHGLRSDGGSVSAGRPGQEQRTDEKTGMADPLEIAISDGIIARKEGPGEGEDVVTICPEKLQLSFTTVIPCMDIKVDGSPLLSGQEGCYVRPVQEKMTQSMLEVEVIRLQNARREPGGEPQNQEKAGESRQRETYGKVWLGAAGTQAEAGILHQNLPSAMWGGNEYSEEMVYHLACGVSYAPVTKGAGMFPEKCFLSEELLSGLNPILRTDSFDFAHNFKPLQYETMGTVKTVSETASRLQKEGKEFLASLGYEGSCDISRLAARADSWLDEDVFVTDEPGWSPE